MKRRALWFGGAALVMTACGPMPGYYSDRESDPKETSSSERAEGAKRRTTVERATPTPTEDGDARDLRVRVGDRDYAPPTGRPSTPAAEPAPAEPEVKIEVERVPLTPPAPVVAEPTTPAAPAAAPSKLQVVPLDRSDSYYLIDRERGLCFFIHKETSAKFDCALIPEARDVVQPSAPVAPAAPAAPESDQGVRRRYVEDLSPAPVKPAPPARRAAAPPAEAAPPSNDAAPSADELTRFEEAYVEISCDRRQGSFTPPRDRIAAAGLTPERYVGIEGWLTSDERAWRLLVNRAYRECDARK